MLLLIGWLVVRDYRLCLLGFIISILGFGAILTAIYEDSKKRPPRARAYLLVVGLVLSFLGYFLGRYVHEWGYILFGLGIVALFVLFIAVITILVEYILKHIERSGESGLDSLDMGFR